MSHSRLTLLHVETWRRFFRALAAPIAYGILILYDPSFAAFIVFIFALCWLGDREII